jgi:hypothetical protein
MPAVICIENRKARAAPVNGIGVAFILIEYIIRCAAEDLGGYSRIGDK